MIEYIKGTLTYKSLDYIVIDIQGLGYQVRVPFKTYERLPDINNEITVFIHTAISEKEIAYYGFYTRTEREVFQTVLTAEGIGPKKSLAILSTYSIEELISIIQEENISLMSKVNGIGKNRAAVIIASLKSKFEKYVFIPESKASTDSKYLTMKQDLKLGLEALGYTKVKVEDYITDEEIKTMKDETEALKYILQKIYKK